MGCSKSLNLNLAAGGDMPLDQAIYSASTGKIFGVRQGWIHRINATTGAVETSARIAPNCFGEACIVEIGAFLYVGLWGGQREADPMTYDPLLEPTYPDRDVYRVNPATLEAVPLNLWKVLSSGWWFNEWGFAKGYRSLCTDGTNLFGLFTYHTNPAGQSGMGGVIFTCVPSNPIATIKADGVGYDSQIYQLIYDSSSAVCWTAASDWSGIEWIDINTWDVVTGFTMDYVDTTGDAMPYGVCHCPLNNHVYAPTQSTLIVKTSKADTATNSYSMFNTPVANATPIRIRYRSSDQRLYVPNWKDDSVTIINPGTDTIVETKTGFLSPVDVVFTPSKAFAVQNSSVGLKEIS